MIDVKRYLPTIFTVAGVIGVPVTSVLSGKAAVKADHMLDGTEDGWKGRFKKTWKCYIPAVISGTVTMASIVASNRFSKREIAAMSATIAYLARNRDKMEQSIRERYGEEALEEIRKDVMAEVYSPKSVEETGYGDVLCFEGYSGRWFRSDPDKINEAIRKFSDDFKDGMGYSCCLNDFYELLGIEPTHFGYQMGWPGVCEPDGDPEYADVYYDDIGFYSEWLDDFKTINGETIPEPVFVIELNESSYPVPWWLEV